MNCIFDAEWDEYCLIGIGGVGDCRCNIEEKPSPDGIVSAGVTIDLQWSLVVVGLGEGVPAGSLSCLYCGNTMTLACLCRSIGPVPGCAFPDLNGST